ncbi:hypothetical protein NECAME_11053 [Necator americanus]|uniref:Uncharacterized protein n=1 Tax=Necator americanus TaxID=51031 RepID=W2T5Y1_NECAM|nr:hypothetical protein NECAME_11053 [Necator americanus]ETN77425.1 hypothetical protein NECAME_11053 [Necator americanus]
MGPSRVRKGTIDDCYATTPTSYTIQEFVTARLRDARLSISAAKALQIAATQVPPCSHSATRALLNLVTQQSDVIVDSIMLNVKDLRCELARGGNSIVKSTEKKLPEVTQLHYENLTRQWNIPQIEPFKACEPKQLIQNYACRQSGRCAKSEHLQDLPEQIARVLIECCVDGLRLGASELLMNADEIKKSPTKYWRELGPTDAVRSKVLSDRKKARAEWGALCRSALGRALADVRQYVFKNFKLVPRPNHGIRMGAVISQLGFNQAFLLALIGIIAMLGLTVVAVSGDSRDNHQNDYALPLVRVRTPAAAPPRKRL